MYNVNARGINKETAVHVAAVRGSLDALQLLVIHNSRDKKEVLAFCDDYGMTPLVLASLRNRVQCVAWMLAVCGLVGFFVGNPSHCSAVHMAAAAGILTDSYSIDCRLEKHQSWGVCFQATWKH